MKLSYKRLFTGASLSLVLVGEATVGMYNGLFTPIGFLILGVLYCLYFLLLEALVVRYRLSNAGIVLVNFALYSVMITGLLHGEISNYITRPDQGVITTLIRIQCSLFPLFVYALLNKIKSAQTPSKTPLWLPIVLLGIFVCILTPSKAFGFITFIDTLRIAPLPAVAYIAAAAFATWYAIRNKATAASQDNKFVFIVSIVLLAIGCIPGIVPFLTLLIIMFIAGISILFVKAFRNASAIDINRN